MPHPFLLFSWNKPFLPELKRRLDTCHADPMTVPTLITPAFRPWKYLQPLYTADRARRLLPRALPYGDMIELWHAALARSNLDRCSMVDSVKLLYDAARDLSPDGSKEDGSPVDLLAGMDLNAFFPWGQKLADLIDELLTNGLLPKDIPFCEGEVLPGAARLLEALGSLGQEYVERLRQHGLVTRGLRCLDIITALEEGEPEDVIPSFLKPAELRPVYVLTAEAPTACQARVYRALWQAGAHICLHSDPGLAEHSFSGRGHGAHWSCREQAAWIEDWGADVELVTGDEETGEKEPKVSFFAGYDLHSQLKALEKALEERTTAENAALILPSSSLLMPVLHHIPESQRSMLNIAMGLPLAETAVCQLVSACLALQASRAGTGEYHWKELAACLDSPVLGSLAMDDGSPLLPALRRFRSQLMRGRRYVDPARDVLTGAALAGRDEEIQALRELLLALVEGFEEARSLAGLADALQKLCDYLREHGAMVREKAPIDMEATYRMEHMLVPMLRNSLMAQDELDLATLTRIFESHCRRDEIAFDPGPALTDAGLQIMSLREAVLLSFDAVYIPDATDDRLPGPTTRDPLLPDSLRVMLDLPPMAAKSSGLAGAFFRLCSSSGHASFFWQEGVGTGELFDGKKTRSRFVEEYLWQLEQREGRLVRAGEPPLEQPSCEVRPMRPGRGRIRLRDQALEAMHAALNGSLSPSAIDDYLTCPMQFGLKRLAKLGKPDTVNEGDDPKGVGTFMHAVLEEFHGRHLGDSLPDRDAAEAELLDCFDQAMGSCTNQLRTTLPPESLAALRVAGRDKLKRYIRNQPEDICPVLLEHSLSCDFAAAGRIVRLHGVMDRLDRRGDGYVLLDYKTGKLHQLNAKFWKGENSAFFSDARALRQAASLDAFERKRLNALFSALAAQGAKLQLAVYLAMAGSGSCSFRQTKGTAPVPSDIAISGVRNAAFVELAKDGMEQDFIQTAKNSKDDPDEVRRQAIARCPDLVGVVLLHMLLAEELPKNQTEANCKYCDYKSICRS